MPPLIHGQVTTLTPWARRLLAPNPGLMTGPGTNTYLIGQQEIALIDPGPAIDSHLNALINATKNQTVRWILVTHTHLDHSPGATVLKHYFPDAQLAGMPAPDAGAQDKHFQPDVILRDNQCLTIESQTLQAIHTPGHASNHLCYWWHSEKLFFTGDHLMEHTTVVIPPPDGNMQDYMTSLTHLLDFPIEYLAPAHGDLIDKPHFIVQQTLRHRRNREAKVLAALGLKSPQTLNELLTTVYAEIPALLHPAARLSLEAHLLKLKAEKQVVQENSLWMLTHDR